MFLDTLGEDINFFMVARKVKADSPWKLYRITEENSCVLDSFSSWQDALVTMKLSCAHIRVLNVPPHTLLYPTYEDAPGIK